MTHIPSKKKYSLYVAQVHFVQIHCKQRFRSRFIPYYTKYPSHDHSTTLFFILPRIICTVIPLLIITIFQHRYLFQAQFVVPLLPVFLRSFINHNIGFNNPLRSYSITIHYQIQLFDHLFTLTLHLTEESIAGELWGTPEGGPWYPSMYHFSFICSLCINRRRHLGTFNMQERQWLLLPHVCLLELYFCFYVWVPTYVLHLCTSYRYMWATVYISIRYIYST
jgi:hypothetical protein